MPLAMFIGGLFKALEGVPMIRDALYAALDSIIAERVAHAREGRIDAYYKLQAAQTPEDAVKALGDIVRNRPV